MELGQIQPSYIYHLGQYQKLLRQRNHLLKQIRRNEIQDETLLQILTEQLIEHACTLLERRFTFIHMLQKWAEPILSDISRQKEQLEIVYNPTIDVSKEDNREKIEKSYYDKFADIQAKEIERGTTLIGPHRDDMTFFVNEKEDRKSTRLNSSHVAISYAVFCLKKKKKSQRSDLTQTSQQ